MSLFKSVTELLASGESLVLATIVSRSGSAPRAAGTRMVVREDASIMGTIGGGVLEAEVRDLAEEVFRHGKTVLREFTFTADDAGLMGMICGGRVQILLHLLDASVPFHLELHRAVLSALKEKERAWLVTRIPSERESEGPPEQGIHGMDGSPAGVFDGATLEEIVSRAGTGRPELVSHAGYHYLVEPLRREGTVFIFGAGHISMDLAPMTKAVGFRTVVLDDREEFANRHRFACADEVVVLSAFESAMQELEIDEESRLVLVTRGHLYDKVLLGQALKTKAGYIGMIGSRRKRDAIYGALLKEGFTSRDLERVHCPIGIDIGAETPEEIAVSIVAELIQQRARRSK